MLRNCNDILSIIHQIHHHNIQLGKHTVQLRLYILYLQYYYKSGSLYSDYLSKLNSYNGKMHNCEVSQFGLSNILLYINNEILLNLIYDDLCLNRKFCMKKNLGMLNNHKDMVYIINLYYHHNNDLDIDKVLLKNYKSENWQSCMLNIDYL